MLNKFLCPFLFRKESKPPANVGQTRPSKATMHLLWKPFKSTPEDFVASHLTLNHCYSARFVRGLLSSIVNNSSPNIASTVSPYSLVISHATPCVSSMTSNQQTRYTQSLLPFRENTKLKNSTSGHQSRVKIRLISSATRLP